MAEDKVDRRNRDLDLRTGKTLGFKDGQHTHHNVAFLGVYDRASEHIQRAAPSLFASWTVYATDGADCE